MHELIDLSWNASSDDEVGSEREIAINVVTTEFHAVVLVRKMIQYQLIKSHFFIFPDLLCAHMIFCVAVHVVKIHCRVILTDRCSFIRDPIM